MQKIFILIHFFFHLAVVEMCLVTDYVHYSRFNYVDLSTEYKAVIFLLLTINLLTFSYASAIFH